MLSKLLKHEFRATGRILLPVYLLLAASTGLFCLTMLLSEKGPDSVAMNIFRVLVIFVFVVTIIGASLITVALMVYRFYKNYMTDEGYLMFTLPATTDQLIWSKLLVAMVWTVVTFLVIAAALALAATTLPFLDLSGLRELLDELSPYLSTGQIVLHVAEGVVSALLSSLRTFLMFYAAIALGHSFANHKILLSVVFYIGFSIALQTVSSFGGVYGLIAASESDIFSGDPEGWTHTLSAGSIVISLLLAVGFYLLTRFCLKKRLNLQ